MDEESFAVRWKRRPKPKEILSTLCISYISDYFIVSRREFCLFRHLWIGLIPIMKRSKSHGVRISVNWNGARLEARLLPKVSYRARVDQAQRPEEVIDPCPRSHLGRSQFASWD